MTIHRALALALAPLVLALGLVGCAHRHRAPPPANSAVELRSFQSRAFDTTDEAKTLRTIIATLQDLGFIVDDADATLGSVSATKPSRRALRITVTVRPRGEKQLVVRANEQSGRNAVTDPGPYQDFFVALEKAMFLTAQQVD